MSERSEKDWLIQAYRVATLSPDPITQNGAVIPFCLEKDACHSHALLLREKVHDYLAACNTVPEKLHVTEERLERPLKYTYVEHAERAVIYTATKLGVSLQGLTMYVPWFACPECARAIIGSGIARIVGHRKMLEDTPSHWRASIECALTMLEEAGIDVVLIDDALPEAPSIRFNGHLWHP